MREFLNSCEYHRYLETHIEKPIKSEICIKNNYAAEIHVEQTGDESFLKKKKKISYIRQPT